MGRDRSTGARAVAALVLTAVVAFAIVGTAADIAAHRIARTDALAEARRTAHGVGTAVIRPDLVRALDGDRAAASDLAAAVASRREDGTLERVMVWGAGGKVLWSDDRALIGRTLPVGPQLASVFADRRDYAYVSSLTSSQQRAEQDPSPHLVEAYVPMTLAGGRPVVLEMLFPDTRVREADRELSDRIVPFTLLALLVLAIGQLPVAIWLVRRTEAAQQDRDRMLETVLVASERERRLLARHLHDGVVQELAGAAFLLTAHGSSPEVPDGTRKAVGVATDTLHQAVGDLREMLVELHPRELSGDNLVDLIATSAIRACPDQKVAVSSRVQRPLPPEVAAFLYRCARECAVNVAKHAAADSVEITLDSDEDGIRLAVKDDGVGIAPDAFDRSDGHLGLVLLRATAVDLGGSLAVDGGPGGTVVTVRLPPTT
jgi:two-component system, NarL family, sensor kinase